MALTVTNALEVPYRIVGNRKKVVKDCEFDESYPEEGEALTLSTLGLSNFVEEAHAEIVAIEGSVNVANAYYDKENEKLILVDETPGEAANKADVSGVKARVTAYGN